MYPDVELDITPLQRANATLRRALERYSKDNEDTEVRDSVIKRFEYTYETSIKTLKRYLNQTSINLQGRGNSVVTPLQDLIREGYAQGILKGDWAVWHEYRDMRNKTSHTYDENIAMSVILVAAKFLNEVEYFAQKIHEVVSFEEKFDNYPTP